MAMREQDIPRLTDLLAGVMDFYAREVSRFQLEVWTEALRGYDLEDVRRALSLHVQDPDRGQWAPKPADITRLLRGGSGDRSLRAWSQVERAIRTIGPYQSVVFDDPIIHAVIDEMGGWVHLCETPRTERDLEFRSQKFRRRYQGYAVTGPREWPSVLHGVIARDNQAAGYAAPEPLIVGDREKARLVHDRGGGNGGSRALPWRELQRCINAET